MSGAPEATHRSDLRDVVASLWAAIGHARYARYLDEGDPAFMQNEYKTGAERAWRISAMIREGSRLGARLLAQDQPGLNGDD